MGYPAAKICDWKLEYSSCEECVWHITLGWLDLVQSTKKRCEIKGQNVGDWAERWNWQYYSL
jgi:hypothetical protein